jgi:tripartite-type tricarboxylate transporter receptor subunit TctC
VRVRSEPGMLERASMRRLGLALAILIAAHAAWPAHAQSYPSRPIRIFVPFAAGGAVDVLARIMGAKLSEQVGQPVLIENRPGAGGTLGADAVAKAPPDGYTILQNTSGAAIAPALYKTLPFDPYKDLVPVTQITGSMLVFVTRPKSDIGSVRDLIARARAQPGKLNYGSSGVGNPLHLTMEMLKHATGIDIVSVPFRGDLQINTALMAGEVEVAVVPMGTSVPHIKEGILRAIGVTGAKRNPALPDVPTIIEQGVPDFVVSGWQGWFMPGGTPAPIVDRIYREIVKMLAQPDMQERIKGFGNEVVGSTPAEFDAYYKAEIIKYTKVIEDAKIPRQ